MSTKVKVGTKAYIFHDPSTGITVKKGEIKELTVAQYNSKRIRSAINGGHLVITNENIEKEIQKDVKVDNKKAIEKFKEMVETTGALTFADEHVIGVAKGCDEEMIKDLNNHFMGECTEVGMYLAMSRQADREGYPEVAEAFKRYAWEEAEHAAKFAELLGDCVWDTKTNLEKRMNAESGACEDKKRIATRAKALNLDAIHDTVHEMAKDEARHGKGFEGLYNRYFKK